MHILLPSAFIIGALSAVAYGQVAISYGNSSVGPDGPWWAISQAVDYPDQFMSLLPSLANNTLIINSSACSSQSANCPLPIPTLWSSSGADAVADNAKTVSGEHSPEQWDANYTALLRMNGSGQFFSERMVLHPDGDTSISDILDYLVMAVSSSYAVTFPGGAGYTLDTGFLSLFGAVPIFSWADVNGFVWSNNRTLPDAYVNGYIPSNSYGLHVGSVANNISGSLVLGGYDMSRCLEEPVISDSNAFSLTSIALNVTSGNSAFTNSSSVPINGILRANGSSVSSLNVIPDPGVPYLYLPQDTCDAIAEHLPVTYDSNFGLYLWNTSAAAYKKIISSPHYMAFTFSDSSSSSTTINIPFALMNLTLTPPLVSEDTPYFPCSPWEPGTTAGYYLGRAFLQGAFLAQNWNSSTLFMAQAPGPGAEDQDIKTISVDDTTITPLTNAPTWDSTWSSTLTGLSGGNGGSNSNSSSSGSNGSGRKHKDASTGLSAGAIAGIVVGVVLGLALLAGLALFFLRRRKRSAKGQALPQHEQEMRPYYGGDPNSHGSAPPRYYDHPEKDAAKQLHGSEPNVLVEAPSAEPVELGGAEVPAQELDGTGKK